MTQDTIKLLRVALKKLYEERAKREKAIRVLEKAVPRGPGRPRKP